jgi:hypothetical protein
MLALGGTGFGFSIPNFFTVALGYATHFQLHQGIEIFQ